MVVELFEKYNIIMQIPWRWYHIRFATEALDANAVEGEADSVVFAFLEGGSITTSPCFISWDEFEVEGGRGRF